MRSAEQSQAHERVSRELLFDAVRKLENTRAKVREAADGTRQSMLLIRISLSCVLQSDFAWSSGLTVPLLFPGDAAR
jgi:hypothetical protein